MDIMTYKYGDILSMEFKDEIDNQNIEYRIINIMISKQGVDIEWDLCGYITERGSAITFDDQIYSVKHYRSTIYGFDDIIKLSNNDTLDCKFITNAIFIEQLPQWNLYNQNHIFYRLNMKFFTKDRIKEEMYKIFRMDGHLTDNKAEGELYGSLKFAIPIGEFVYKEIQSFIKDKIGYNGEILNMSFILVADTKCLYILNSYYSMIRIMTLLELHQFIMESTPKFNMLKIGYKDIVIIH